MEQKKTLWIIAAVGVFLLVVLGAALIFSSNSNLEVEKNNIIPIDKNANDVWSSPTTNTFDLNAQENLTDGPNVSEVKDMIIVSENTTIFDLNQDSNETPATIDLNTLKTQNIYGDVVPETQVSFPQNQVQNNNQAKAPVITNENTTLSTNNDATQYYVGENRSAQKAEQAEKKTSVKQVQPKTSATVVNTPKTQNKTQNTKASSTSTKKTSTPSKTSTSVTTKKADVRYWVQVASYTNKKTAENSRTVLLDNKISSDIYTYQDANKKLYYRVRVGPFTTKSEAEYWMSKITQIKDFSKAGSYVTSTTDR